MNIYESITKIMEDIPAIGKDKVNSQQHFKFRGIDDVMNVMQPILAKHKVFVVPQVLEQTREERVTSKGGNLIYSMLRIKFIFYAEDGTYVEAITEGEGMDSGDKASNKAMSIAFKYALFQVFCIPTEEMLDPDQETQEESKPNKRISKEQVDYMTNFCINNHLSKDFLINTLTKYGYNEIYEIKEQDYKKIGIELKKGLTDEYDNT